MAWTPQQLATIFARTSGKCHLCHGRLARKNYGKHGARGGWHVEHSKARVRGGTDHGNNLLPAHIDCNLKKGTASARSVRAANGKRKKPMSLEQRERVLLRNSMIGTVLGTAGGVLVGGPVGAVVGLIAGGVLGSQVQPHDE